MLGSFFKFVKEIGKKNRWLRDSMFYKKIIHPLWNKIRFLVYEKPEAIHNSIHYFTDNRERMERIVSWLADEESKKTFLQIIKFRCYRKKKDFISHGEDTKYFINDFFKWKENEVIIDCGAYDGDSIEKFISLHPKYNQIIAFEPDAKNYAKLQYKFRNNPKIRTINTGVSNENGELFFLSERGESSKIVSEPDSDTISIRVSSIDSLNLPYVSIIKMDIEGAEMQALKGAENTILKNKPKLVICIYHSNEDMLKIAEYIHELLPEYKLYVRNHAKKWETNETVLYAQMEEK